MKAAAHVLELLEMLEALFPSFRPGPRTAAAWSAVLAGYSPDELRRAAALLARNHVHGAPSTANVVEAIEGVLVRVPVFATALNGSRLLDTAGAPRISHYETRRVPYGEETALLPDPTGEARARTVPARPLDGGCK